MALDLAIGDAVIPETEPDHDVMTVYDFECGYSIALCNWVIGSRMFRAKYPSGSLIRCSRKRGR